MPYRVRKVKCRRSDGKKGKYVLEYKPKKKTKKKKTKAGYVRAGCHTSKKKANAQRSAIEGGPREMHVRSLDKILAEIDETDENSYTWAFSEEKKKAKKAGKKSFTFDGKKYSTSTGKELNETDEAKKHPPQYSPQSKTHKGQTRGKHLTDASDGLKNIDKDLEAGKITAAQAKEKKAKIYADRARVEDEERKKDSFKNVPRSDSKSANESVYSDLDLLLEVIELTEKRKRRRKGKKPGPKPGSRRKKSTRKSTKRKSSSSGGLSAKTKETLRKKANSRGLTPGSVYSEYRKGLAAWATSGSRKGMSQHQWAMARVNSANPSKSWATVKKSKAKKK